MSRHPRGEHGARGPQLPQEAALSVLHSLAPQRAVPQVGAPSLGCTGFPRSGLEGGLGMPKPGGPNQPTAGDPASLRPRCRAQASRLPGRPHSGTGQSRLTQSSAIWLLPLLLGQVPLQFGAEEQERVIVRGFLYLARKVDRSGKVQWTRSRAPSPCSSEKRTESESVSPQSLETTSES